MPARGLTLGALLLLLPCGAPAQSTRLEERLKDLNVRLETDHYLLAGTVSDRALQEYGRLLEFIHREYAAGFAEVLKDAQPATSPSAAQPAKSPRPARKLAKSGKKSARVDAKSAAPDEAPPRTMDQEDEARRFRVLVFGTDNEYQDFGREFLRGSTEHTGGMFLSGPGVLLILDRGNPDDTAEVLFHEAFHQFVHRYLKDPPMWLNEGLATYYGTARVDRGGLTFVPDPDLWKLVRKALDKDLSIPLSEVVQASRAQFYDPTPIHISGFEDLRRRNLFYAEAYTLVHLLIADPTGRRRLHDYIRDLARDDGRNTARITAEYFGPDTCAHMTTFWIKHVRSRPENR